MAGEGRRGGGKQDEVRRESQDVRHDRGNNNKVGTWASEPWREREGLVCDGGVCGWRWRLVG
jgi:hypothetical protein